MPCRSDYMEPTELECEAGRLNLLLHEASGGEPADPIEYRDASEYGVEQRLVDERTRRLCAILSDWSPDDLKESSLELQMWWRDHSKLDAARRAQEQAYVVTDSMRVKIDAIRRALADATNEAHHLEKTDVYRELNTAYCVMATLWQNVTRASRMPGEQPAVRLVAKKKSAKPKPKKIRRKRFE